MHEKDDLISDSSVNSRRKETEDILKDIFENSPHFMSAGARREVNKIKAGFVVLAVATVVGMWAFTNRADSHLRRDINSVNRANCLAGIQTVHKYNDLIDSIIQTRIESLRSDRKYDNKSAAKVDRSAIKRYQADKIIPPTVKACQRPILK